MAILLDWPLTRALPDGYLYDVVFGESVRLWGSGAEFEIVQAATGLADRSDAVHALDDQAWAAYLDAGDFAERVTGASASRCVDLLTRIFGAPPDAD